MADKETGWTKEFPQVEGFYFARRTQTNVPALTVIQVWQYEDEWFAYRFANQNDIEAEDFVRSLYEYLGPLTVSDFEQLVALKGAAEIADQWFNDHFVEIPCTIPIGPVTAALREALKDHKS